MFKKIIPILFYPVVILFLVVMMGAFKHEASLSTSEAEEIDRFLLVEKRLNDRHEQQQDDSIKGETIQTQTAAQTTRELPSVYVNDQGEHVRYLQTLLNIEDDGVYGQETYEKVLEFQRMNELETTGVVDEKTWEKLQTEA